MPLKTALTQTLSKFFMHQGNDIRVSQSVSASLTVSPSITPLGTSSSKE